MASVPKKFDWRDHDPNVLSPVRNQEQCNCCWAIAAVGAIEALYNIYYRDPESEELLCLSPHYVLNCLDEGNPTKETSTIEKAFAWITKNGIVKEIDCPFKAQKENCHCIEDVALKIKDFGTVSLDNIYELDQHIMRQPIAARIKLTQELWDFQGDDIYYGPDDGDDLLNSDGHAILIVGFGCDWNKSEYWIVKNSWGEGWGNRGYGKISKWPVATSKGMKSLLGRFSYPIGIEKLNM